MQQPRPLLVASLFGIVITVACGCGNQDASRYRTYTPSDEPVVESGATPAEPETPPPAADLPDVESAATETVADDPATDPEDPGDAADQEIVETPVEPSAAAPALADNAVPDRETLLAMAAAPKVAADPIEPRETKLLIPEKSFRKEGDALRVSYDDIDLLKVLNMEPVTADAPEHFPTWLKDLDGQRIRIRGYMRPGLLSKEIPFFVLARDTMACCFGPNTKAYDIIPVMMREGVTTDYIHMQPFDLVGDFHINVEMDLDDPNKVEFVYFIDDAVLIKK